MTTVHETSRIAADPEASFDRVLVGIDGSEESLEAARLAALLTDGELTLLAAYDVTPPLAGATGTSVPLYLDVDVQREAAQDAVRRVKDELGDRSPAAKVAQGRAWERLKRETERARDTLVVVGSHGIGRARGIVMGSTATEVIHGAPCSVLVVRGTAAVPRKIVVGVDGSPESAAAFAAARHLAERFGATLSPVVARDGKDVDLRAVTAIAGENREELLDDPVTALVVAAADADLVVVGSRGLHGLKALGSVSERVAHRARASVLIVREPAWA